MPPSPRRRLCALLSGLALFLGTLALGMAQAPEPRAPVPSLEEQKKAEENLKTKIYKEAYAKAEKDAAARQALIADLMEKARSTADDVVLRYVAFREARDMA